MSGGDDDFLARWSRRKRAARAGEAGADEGTAPDADPQVPAAAPPAEPPEPLPKLEDLTAESDLAAFLREGVPAALRNAAMRRMWSLDPVVRDYVGPSEYAWNFNQPGSMPGFGPLGAAPSVAGLLSTARRVLPDGSSGAAPEPAAPPPRRVADDAPEQAAPVEPPDTGEEEGPTADERTEETDPAAPSRTPSRPRHGGALPK
jgi:hypothetical protein